MKNPESWFSKEHGDLFVENPKNLEANKKRAKKYYQSLLQLDEKENCVTTYPDLWDECERQN